MNLVRKTFKERNKIKKEKKEIIAQNSSPNKKESKEVNLHVSLR